MRSRQGFEYSIIKDSHMYYFLQSVPKVRQLLSTGLYKLQGRELVELATKQSVQLEPYVADKLKEIVLTKRDENQEVLNAVIQSEKFKAFEEERVRLKKMRQGTNTGESRVRNQLDKIRGLKEFMERQGK